MGLILACLKYHATPFVSMAPLRDCLVTPYARGFVLQGIKIGCTFLQVTFPGSSPELKPRSSSFYFLFYFFQPWFSKQEKWKPDGSLTKLDKVDVHASEDP